MRDASPAGFTAENTNLFSSDSSGEDDLESAVACEADPLDLDMEESMGTPDGIGLHM